MKRSIGLAAFACLFVAGTVHGQEAITIKLKERGAGEAAIVKRSETTSSKVTVSDGGGNVVLDQKEIKKDVMEYTETIVKREAGKQPTEVLRDYTKALSGKEDKLLDLGLQGKSVKIVKKDDGFSFFYKDGKELEGPALTALTKDFTKKSDSNAELEKLVLPKGAVKPGESWKIDMKKIAAELSKQGAMDLDLAKSTGEGKLVKAYKKDGRQFGEMTFKMEMPINTIGKGKGVMKFGAGAKIAIDLTFDVCVDGTAETGTLKMKMVMAGNATIPDAPGATATMNVSVEATQSQQEAAKK